MDRRSVHDIRAVVALLADVTFAPLAEEAVRDYIDWDDLTRRPLPAGLSADDTWRLLTTLRRFGATRFPLQDLQGRTYWYTLTREASVCVDAIERYCRADSTVHRAILHRHGTRVLVETQIRETLAACRLDGVVVSSTDAEGLLMSGRAPRNATEHFVLNAHALLHEDDAMDEEPFSPEMLRRLHLRLLENVDVSQLERRPVRQGLSERVEAEPVTGEARAKVIQQYCDYANGLTGDPSEPVAMKAHALLNTGIFWAFFPDFVGIVGRGVFRRYATRQDYPVLGSLPVSAMYETWEHGQASPSIIRFSHLPSPRSSDDTEVDYTADVLTYLQLTVAALDDLLRSLDHARRRDAEVRSVLEHDVDLNYRQRSILAEALAHPAQEFRIREHQTTHNVVYATSRADLIDLVDRGYLRREQHGKAFVFVPQRDLLDRLDRETDQDTPG